jgi:serine/tyrosine/threonine adenylyltransferase
MLTNQCRAIDSAPAKDVRRMPQSESIEKPSIAEHPIAVFSNSYARLPEHFFARVSPTPVAGPHLIKFNELLAEDLGLDTRGLGADALAGIFGGNVVPLGAEPIAMAYAAHQFGNFVPQLGDGRAILVGEVVDRNGERRDIQLKGAGRTPFSRRGDGRAALGPVLREYLVSEAMHALGIPTTRALAAVSTGERVFRDRPLPGAVLTRVASSHIRIGTFQYFAVRGDREAVERLARYVIDRHFPDARASERPILALLQSVVERQASLVARWMHVGFIHGVMNTDNTALSGETIDFGPCAFMDSYDPTTTFSAIDELGRYAYGNQPTIAQWNLARFAETMVPLLDPDPELAIELANEAISAFSSRFQEHWLAGMRDKLGLVRKEGGDLELVHALLRAMHENAADFTLTFRRLCDVAANEKADANVRALFANPAAYDSWASSWRSRLAAEKLEPDARAEAMRKVNPAFIPRNHRVEQALDAAIEYGDFSLFAELLTVLSRPYEDQAGFADYANPPHADERIFRTFCGT